MRRRILTLALVGLFGALSITSTAEACGGRKHKAGCGGGGHARGGLGLRGGGRGHGGGHGYAPVQVHGGGYNSFHSYGVPAQGCGQPMWGPGSSMVGGHMAGGPMMAY